jgi:hypothetical protein
MLHPLHKAGMTFHGRTKPLTAEHAENAEAIPVNLCGLSALRGERLCGACR